MTNEEAKMQIQAIPEKIWDQLSEPDREAMEMVFSAFEKKGKWVDNTYCSECGWVHETDHGFVGSVDGFNFCPNCGADMREDTDEQT